MSLSLGERYFEKGGLKMRKLITRITICTVMGLSFSWFWYHEYIKPPQKHSGIYKMENLIQYNKRSIKSSAVVSKQEKPIKIYTKIINGRWAE